MSLWSNDRHVKPNDLEDDLQGFLFTPETATTAFTTPDLSFKDILVEFEDDTSQGNNHALGEPVDAFFTAGDSDTFDRPQFWGYGGIAIEDRHRPIEPLHSDHIVRSQVRVHGVDNGDPIYTLSPVVLDDPLPTLSLPDASSSPPAQLPVALPPSAFQQSHGQHITEYMRAKLSLPSDVPVGLWSVPDPPEGERPRASLEVLICLAICGSEKKMLPLHVIHQNIAARFPYYRDREEWQGSIRHALSLYSIFKMRSREEDDRGRGNNWTLDVAGAERKRYKRPRTRSDKKTQTTRTNKKPSRLRNADDDSDPAIASGSHIDQARGISSESPVVAALGNNRDAVRSVLSSGARDLQGPIRASRTLWRQASANSTTLTASPASVEAGVRRAGGRAGSGKQPRHGGKAIF